MLRSADFESYINYFRQFAQLSPDIEYFLYGGVELGIQYATGADGFNYPFMWLEQPEIISDDNDASQLTEIYYGGVSIIFAPPLDRPQEQIQAEIDSIRIIYKLQKQMRADNRSKGFVHCNLAKMRKSAVDRAWANNHHGWRLEFELHLNANGLLS
ncbi:hypothetical protein [Arundinibacter roseus]|uniref:Uncharacterized protein n=1 Tax=Arundinibacter roseus TaxID=2070510 RepID=A0A4R4KIY6_9BACT|nr:hypothetical protein [Arundinibacter roseus]TDB66802.1 hypothetical protein EZE20_06665 [Arundinibacter roseus]